MLTLLPTTSLSAQTQPAPVEPAPVVADSAPPLDLAALASIGTGTASGSGAAATTAAQSGQDASTAWGTVVREILVFTAIQHTVRMAEPRTRMHLGGPWVNDWFRSAASLVTPPTWSDGGGHFTNYVAHPWGGSVYAHFYGRHDPQRPRLSPGLSRGYLGHLARASSVSALASLQFEIGPLSEASIGNVGLPPNRHKMAWVDLVVTPLVGTAWMAVEDTIDRYVIERFERRYPNKKYLRKVIRSFLNPTRSVANVTAFERPWKRRNR